MNLAALLLALGIALPSLATEPTTAQATPLTDAQLTQLGEQYLKAWNEADIKLLKKWVTAEYIEQAGGEAELKRKLNRFSSKTSGKLTEVTFKTENDIPFVRFVYDRTPKIALFPAEEATLAPRKQSPFDDGWFRVETMGAVGTGHPLVDIWVED